jgi:hypothetical protein
MITVQKATISLFDAIFPLLDFFAVKEMDRENWFALLNTRWSARYDHFGYVLLDDERVVGFLGTFFSDRVVDGKEYAICNLFCWHVLEEYRRESLLLLRPILQLQDTCITALTSSEGATAVYRRFAFKELETQVMIYPFRPSFSLCSNIECIRGKDSIQAKLAGSHLKILSDHRFVSCGHLVVFDSKIQDYCYLLYNRIQKKGFHFTQVYFISNGSLFKKAFSKIQWFFLKENKTLFTIVDKRLIANCHPGFGYSYTLRYPRLYHFDDLPPEKIDNLYSELLFLKSV